MKKSILFAIAVSCLIPLLSGQTVPSYVPTNGLIGWWPFNGNANDESGNFNHGMVNGAILTNDRLGNPNMAYRFDGVDDYIDCGNVSAMNGLTEITISAWVKVSGISNYARIISKENRNDQTQGINLKLAGPTDHGSQLGAFGSNIRTGAVTPSVYSDVVPVLDFWYHVVLVYDGTQQANSDKAIMYLDGALNPTVYTSTLPSILSNSNASLWFGNISPNPTVFPFNGTIDDIGIWNRVLTVEEIEILYSGCLDSIQSHPQTATFNTNPGIAWFTCKASDSLATYQWQQNSGTGWINLSNAGPYFGTDTDSLVIQGITPAMNNYQFRCIINDCKVDTTMPALLTVNDNVGLQSIQNQHSIKIYPNPTNSEFIIDTKTELIGQPYSLIDLIGRTLLTGTITSNLTIVNISHLSASIYILQVGSDTRSSISIVKQ